MNKPKSTAAIIQSEQSVLSCMIIRNKCIPAVRQILKADDFSRTIHQIVFGVICTLYDAKVSPIDIPEILVEMQNQPKYESQDEEYIYFMSLDAIAENELREIRDTSVTGTNAEYHARKVKQASNKLKSCELSALIYEKSQESTTNYDDLIELAQQIVDAGKDETGSSLIMANDASQAYYSRVTEIRDRDPLLYCSTTFPTLDNEFGLFGEPNVIVLKGRRGSGKTQLLVHWTVSIAKAGHAVAVYSLDTSRDRLTDRIIANLGGFDSKTVRHCKDEASLAMIADAVAEYDKLPIAISGKSGITIKTMKHECKQLQEQGHHLGLVIIDFAELVGKSDKKASTREQELANMCQDLREMTNELGCTVALLSQMNQTGGERNSEMIGNLADVLLAWTVENGYGKLTGEKNRFGDGFIIDCSIDFSQSIIRELSKRSEPEATNEML